MKRFLFALMAATVVETPAAAMDVATFLREADALEAMGARAIFSSRGRVVMDELSQTTRALREERMAALARGRRPAYCPDDNNRATPQELIASLRTIPEARRPRVQLRDAMRVFYIRRYPCPA